MATLHFLYAAHNDNETAHQSPSPCDRPLYDVPDLNGQRHNLESHLRVGQANDLRWYAWLGGLDVIAHLHGDLYRLNVDAYGDSIPDAIRKLDRRLRHESPRVTFLLKPPQRIQRLRVVQ